ncbi:MAG TPA: hypothetical protein VMZ71_01080 [Gemmataceae bacterium]|nr:hypothetical protein [Gemmataceae bacterium]
MTLRDDLNAKRMRDRVRAWKRLPESADADPSLADVLARGLADSHVLIRLAAARAVPAFARHSLHLVPLLIRRRFEPDARVRHAAAVGLAWVLPYIVGECPPKPRWGSGLKWAVRLTGRDAHPGRVMFFESKAKGWPPAVEAELLAACERRRRWHLTNSGRTVEELPPKPLQKLSWVAAASAMRPGWPDRTNAFARFGEFAWQLALAWELCQNATRPSSSIG